MKKSLAENYFNEIYNATFDDTITYIFGKTGNPDILYDVLFNTYSVLYGYLKKQRRYNEEQVSDFFYTCLNDMLNEFAPSDMTSPREITPSDKQAVDALLETEFDLADEKAVDDFLIKKAHSFVLQKSSTERKIFVLYFYKGFDVRRISGLLGVDAAVVYGCVNTLLTEIKDNFLASYIKK